MSISIDSQLALSSQRGILPVQFQGLEFNFTYTGTIKRFTETGGAIIDVDNMRNNTAQQPIEGFLSPRDFPKDREFHVGDTINVQLLEIFSATPILGQQNIRVRLTAKGITK